MAVHVKEKDLRVLRLAFEGRYDEGFRYLDHCGEAMVALRKHNPAWEAGQPTPAGTALILKAEKIAFRFDSDSLSLTNSENMDVIEAQERLKCLAREASAIYNIVLDALRVPNTTRVGARFWFAAPADSLEEADRFLCKSIQSPAIEQICEIATTETRNVHLRLVTEDVHTGYRYTFQLSSVLKQEPELPPVTGFPLEGAKGFVLVDTDTYTRPESGHFSGIEAFINNAYFRAHEQAIKIFRSMSQVQR